MNLLDALLAALIAIPIAAFLIFMAGCYLTEAVRKVWRQR